MEVIYGEGENPYKVTAPCSLRELISTTPFWLFACLEGLNLQGDIPPARSVG